MKRMLALISGFSILTFACATRISVREHPEFATRKASIANILVVPPLVEIRRRVASGEIETLKDEAERVANDLTGIVINEFSTRGFKGVSGKEKISQDPNLVKTTDDMFRELSAAIWQPLTDVEKEAKNFKHTLSRDLSGLATTTSTDTIVFVKFGGFTRSGGDVAREFGSAMLVGVFTAGLFVPPKNPSGAAVLDLALVDGRSGDILWANRSAKSFWGLTGPDFLTEDSSELASKLLNEFPH